MVLIDCSGIVLALNDCVTYYCSVNSLDIILWLVVVLLLLFPEGRSRQNYPREISRAELMKNDGSFLSDFVLITITTLELITVVNRVH